MKPRTKNPATAVDRSSDQEWEPAELQPDHVRVKLASALDDYLDEEVVDNTGQSLGTLACYWEGADGRLVFCGIKKEGQDGVRVAPGDDAQLSERHSWVRIPFPAAKVNTAPRYECDQELDSAFEHAIYEHYEVEDFQPHGGLKYLAGGPKS